MRGRGATNRRLLRVGAVALLGLLLATASPALRSSPHIATPPLDDDFPPDWSAADRRAAEDCWRRGPGWVVLMRHVPIGPHTTRYGYGSCEFFLWGDDTPR